MDVGNLWRYDLCHYNCNILWELTVCQPVLLDNFLHTLPGSCPISSLVASFYNNIIGLFYLELEGTSFKALHKGLQGMKIFCAMDIRLIEITKDGHRVEVYFCNIEQNYGGCPQDQQIS